MHFFVSLLSYRPNLSLTLLATTFIKIPSSFTRWRPRVTILWSCSFRFSSSSVGFLVLSVACFKSSFKLAARYVCVTFFLPFSLRPLFPSPFVSLLLYHLVFTTGVFVFVKVILILSGNLSFLNWLTILPSIFCFDDRSLAWLFPESSKRAVAKLQQEDKDGIRRSRGQNFLVHATSPRTTTATA